MRFSRFVKIVCLLTFVLITLGVLASCAESNTEPVYIIYFNVNGGEGNTTYTYTNGYTNIVLPAKPSRAGFTFEGWFFNLGTSNEYQLKEDTLLSKPITRSVTVLAKWKPIDIISDDGQKPEPDEEEPLQSYLVSLVISATETRGIVVADQITSADLPAYQREEYEFKGWYLDSSYSGSPIALPYKLNSDIILYAKWEAHTYRVSFNKGSTAVSGATPNEVFLAKGQTFTIPQSNLAYYDGDEIYRFIGWTIDNTKVYHAGDSFTLTEPLSVIFNAVWERLYSVTFDIDNEVAPPKGSFDFGVGESFTISDIPQRVGYVFNSWIYKSENRPFDSEFIMETGGITLGIKWDKIHTITFGIASGDFAEGTAPQPIECIVGTEIELPNNPFSYENHIFDGWTVNGAAKYLEGDTFITPDEDVHFVAVWKTSILYTITFLAGSALGTPATGEPPKSLSYPENTSITLPDHLNKLSLPHYRFVGWSYEGITYRPALDIFVTKDKNIDVVAVWEPVVYTISYSTGEGFGNGGNKTTYTILDDPITLNPITDLVGYSFGGWFTDSQRTNPVTGAIDTSNPTNLVFFAKLVPERYKIYLNDGITDDCSFITSSLLSDATGYYVEVVFDSEYENLINLQNLTFVQNSGYIPAFWVISGRTEPYIPATVWKSVENLSLKLIWSIDGAREPDLTIVSNGDGTATITAYNGTAENVIIPTYSKANDKITGIGSFAFYGKNIKSIVLHDDIVSIGSHAFTASSLVGIYIPSSITHISDNAFNGANNLEYVIFDEACNISSVGASAFANCTSLLYIRMSGNIVYMAQNVFQNSVNASVYIKQMYPSPAWHVNWNISNSRVYYGLIKEGDYYVAVSEQGLVVAEYTGNSKHVTLGQILGINVKVIEGYAFRGKSDIESVTLPASVTRVEPKGFNLNTIVYFQGNYNLLENSGLQSFASIKAANLTEGDWLYAITYSDNAVLIKYLGQDSDITISNTISTYPILDLNKDAFIGTEVVSVAIATQNSVAWFKSIQNISMSYSQSQVDADGFRTLGGELISYEGTEKRLTILAGQFSSILKEAFKGHSGLIVYYDDDSAYEGGWNGGIVSYKLADVKDSGDFKYILDSEGFVFIVDYTGGQSDIEIPTILGGKGVIGIALNAFKNAAISSAVVPISVIFLPSEAFDTNVAFLRPTSYSRLEFGYYVQDGYAFITDYFGFDSHLELPTTIEGYTVKGIVNALPSFVKAIRLNGFVDALLVINTNTDIYVYNEIGSYSNVYFGNRQVKVFDECNFYEVEGVSYAGFSGGVLVYAISAYPGSRVVLSEDVTHITDYAFSNVNGISLVIDDLCLNISEFAFNGLTNSRIYLLRELLNESFEIYDNMLYTLSSGRYYFDPATSLEFMLDDMKAVLTGYVGGIVDLVIPRTLEGKPVTAIARNSFYAKDIISLTIASSVTSISADALRVCRIIDRIIVEAKTEPANWQSGWNAGVTTVYNDSQVLSNNFYEFILLSANEVFILEYVDTSNSIVEIPTMIDNRIVRGVRAGIFASKNVTSVKFPDGYYNFADIISGCKSLETIYIPASVKVIPDRAFKGLTNLTTVIFEGNSVYSIGNEAFMGAVKLANFTMPDTVTFIGEAAFAGCQSLQSITLPAAIVEIGERTFALCKSLAYVNLDNIKAIGDYAFDGCSSLILANLSAVDAIGVGAFAGCSLLTNITLSDNIKTIKADTFSGCSLLTTFDANNIEYIEDRAFMNAVSLTSISIIKAIEIGDSAFENCVNLTLTLGNSLEVVGKRSFFGVLNMGDVNIGAKLNRIGLDAFANANVTRFTVDSNNNMYLGKDGDLYDKLGLILIKEKS